MTIVVTGATELAAYLTGSVARLEVNAATAVAVTARKVQTAARARIRGHKYLPAYPASITYDITRAAGGAQGEIGPDKGRAQGALGNIIEFGTVNNAPIEHLGPALEENAEDLEHGVGIAVLQALR